MLRLCRSWPGTRRANGAIQASGLQPLPGAPAANLSRLAARQSTSSHNLYAPNTILNAALTPAPDHPGAGAAPLTRRGADLRDLELPVREYP